MDLPDAELNRDRGLPLDKDRPSVRLLRPSDPNSDPEYRGSLDAPVALKGSDSQLFPASPGQVLVKVDDAVETTPPQLTLSNVGHRDISTGEVMPDDRKTDESTKMTLHLQSASGGHVDMSPFHRIPMMSCLHRADSVVMGIL